MKSTYYQYIGYLAIILGFVCLSSCKKFLDTKPNKATTTIASIKDLQGLLNNNITMNQFGAPISFLGADEYVLSESEYAGLQSEIYRKAYVWDPNAYFEEADWTTSYNKVYTSNLVLQELERIDDGSTIERNVVKGEALFLRSFVFYELAQIYCKPFTSDAATDAGLPLRLTANVEEHIQRATVEQTYERILADLIEATDLLPIKASSVNHPRKLACYALLARVYLSMRDYENAEKYAGLYLQESPELIDFNTLSSDANPSISATNIESSFFAYYSGEIPGPSTMVNPQLVNSYHENDLRRSILLLVNPDQSANFKGSYQGEIPYGEGYTSFCGLATNEVYLISAECKARLEDIPGAMNDLNTLLVNRWKTGEFTPLTASSKEEAVDLILTEKYKELIFRGTRWSDLRRLNIEGGNIDLVRVVGGETYQLPANDKRWVWLIPREVITLSAIPQNER